jgi:hypothetical protein
MIIKNFRLVLLLFGIVFVVLQAVGRGNGMKNQWIIKT